MQNYKLKLKTELQNRTYRYSIKVMNALDSLPKNMTNSVISRQLFRSATSVGANITEAQGASSKRDFANFYTHALKSANESLYWVGLLIDGKNIRTEEIEDVFDETRQLANILGSSILTLKGKRS